MRVQKPSIRLIATLAFFIAILFATGTRATAADNVLHSFQRRHGRELSLRRADLRCRRQSLRHHRPTVALTGGGTVFELTPGAGGTWTEKVLHSFITTARTGIFPKPA